MKKIYKSIPILLIAFAIMGVFASCNNEDVNQGTPQISYVRVTKPESADSLLVAAGQGQLVAIIGDNLQDARQIWFNDQKSSLTATYITKKSILVSVPSHIPLSVNNKLKIYFANGDSLLYDFKVTVNKPEIASMNCEYVLDGKVATIHGNYFYAPISVTFPGGKLGENISVDAANQIITVTVPTGTQPGQIIVTTNFGIAKSDFWFRDNRNIILSSDPYAGWWNASFVVTNPGPTDPPSINGNYIRVKKNLGAWGWLEIAGGPASEMNKSNNEAKNIPDEAIQKPSLYNLKFEVCTTKPYNGSGFLINVGTADGDHGNYNWAPPYDTKGVWQTVAIPYEDVVKAYTVPLVVNPNGYWTRFVFQGGTALDCDMSFDNFRVVPKTIKP